MLLESGKVGGGAVAFVLGETVCGPLFVVLKHESVPSDLGEDAGGGDAKTLGVALDDSGLRRGERGHGATVYQRVRRGRCELGKSGVHRSIGGLEDVDLVDEHSVYDADAKLISVFAWMAPKSSTRIFSVSCLESLRRCRDSGRPSVTHSAGNTAAAATTGPASGPRPASSTPAKRVKPRA